MASVFAAPDNKQLIYLYDLPKNIVTSVKIAKIIKDACGYDLQEPVQFRESRPNPLTGVSSPFQFGIIKVDANQGATIAKAIKYFEIDDGVDADGTARKWQCRALPFDRELLGANKNSTNAQLNSFIKGLPKEMSSKDLEESYKQFGEVKSAKVSYSVDTKKNTQGNPISNGYGFVCFQTPEGREAAISAKVEGQVIYPYQPKDNREIRKAYNNIYVKNYSPNWDEAKLKEVFSQFGDIKSLFIMTKEDKEGNKKPFAFVCYEKTDDKAYGPQCAENAVRDLHEKEVDGFKLYVQPAVPKDQRQAQVLREQQRFKNSKKKCNLFVKGFPATFGEQQLREIFQVYGEIESIKIIKALNDDGSEKPAGSRAFVCFKQPDSAANARASVHNQSCEGKTLFVTNYELPEIRKKQQTEARDRADFMTQRKLQATPLDSTLLQRPDTIQLIQQILLLLQRNMGGNFRQNPQQNYNRGPMQNQNRPMGPGGNRGLSQGRRPQHQQQQPLPQYGVPVPQNIAPAPMAVPPQTVSIKGDFQPLAHPDPMINSYNQQGFTLLPAMVPQNPKYKQFVGEFIYEYVEKFVGEERAPKITGMLIDLPIEEIKAFLYDFQKLHQKVGEAVAILAQLAATQGQTAQ